MKNNIIKSFKFMKQETLESILLYQGRPGKNQLDMIKQVERVCNLRVPIKVEEHKNYNPVTTRFYVNYYCGKCGMGVKKDFKTCPYCENKIDWSDIDGEYEETHNF